MNFIYKIATSEQWQAAQASGVFAGAPVDLADGFIHFSTSEQVRETAAKHFAGQDQLILAAFDPALFGDALKWEPSRGGALFPHLYRSVSLHEALWVRPLVWRDGAHDFSGLLPEPRS